MKPLIQLLLQLYPRAWRARYGDEFQALLEDAPPDCRGTLDLLKGAIQMQSSIRNYPRLALVLSGLGALAGLGLSYLATPQFKSSADLALSAPWTATPQQHRNLAELYFQLKNELLGRTSLSAVIQDPQLDLYSQERQSMPIEDVIAVMRRGVKIEPLERPGVSGQDWFGFEISFAYPEPSKTQMTVRRLLTRLQEANLNLQRDVSRTAGEKQSVEIYRLEARIVELERKLGIAERGMEVSRTLEQNRRGSGINLEVLDPPSLPALPARPNRKAFALFGFAGGFALASLLALFRRRWPQAPLSA